MRMTAKAIVNKLLEYGPGEYDLPPERAGGPEDMWRPPQAALGRLQPMDFAPRPGVPPEPEEMGAELIEPGDLLDQPSSDPALDQILGKTPGQPPPPTPPSPPAQNVPIRHANPRFTWTPPPGHDL